MSLTVEWLTEADDVVGAGEQGGGREQGAGMVCARDSVEVWVVVAELQLVQRPWGAIKGSPMMVQPWVALVALLPAEGGSGTEGLAPRGPGTSDHRGAEIHVRLESVGGSNSDAHELGSAICGDIPVALDEDAESMERHFGIEQGGLESGDDLQGNVAKFRNLALPNEDSEAKDEGGMRVPEGLYVLIFTVGSMCGIDNGKGEDRGHHRLSYVRSLWKAKCIEGSMAKSLSVDLAVFGSERDSAAATSVHRLRGLAEILLRERIASISARLAEEANDSAGYQGRGGGRGEESAAKRRLLQESESLPLLRRLLAEIPDGDAIISSGALASDQLRRSAGVQGCVGSDESSQCAESDRLARASSNCDREAREGGAREKGRASVRVAVCVSGAMRALQPGLLHETLLSKLEEYDMFVYTPDDGTAVRLPALSISAADIMTDYPLNMGLTDASDYVYASPYNMVPVQRLVQLWHGVDRCFRLIQRAEARLGRKYDLVIRARPDIMIKGLSAADFGWSSPAMHTVLVPATPRQARWAHITDVFACGPRDLMATYMTIFRSCLYTARTPLYDTHPRWDSEEKLEKCLLDLGVPWRHVAHWRFVALRARSSCGSTGCWDHNAFNDDSAEDGPFRYFRNGTRAF